MLCPASIDLALLGAIIERPAEAVPVKADEQYTPSGSSGVMASVPMIIDILRWYLRFESSASITENASTSKFVGTV